MTVSEGIVGPPGMAQGAGVALGSAVEAGAVSVAQFLPDPPVIIGPDVIEIAITVAEEDDLRWLFDVGRPADIVLGRVTRGRVGWAPKRGRRTSTFPMHIHGAQAAA